MTYQCQLFTFVASGRSSTIQRGSPSPHLAIISYLRMRYLHRNDYAYNLQKKIQKSASEKAHAQIYDEDYRNVC